MLARGLRSEMTARQTTPVQHQSAESHLHRLEPLHPAALAFLAMQDSAPVASAPMGPARCAGAGAAWAARGGRPGGAIKPEVLADPHRGLGLHGAGVVGTASGETLTAWHLGCRACTSRALISRPSIR